jgi:hypothetical protein
MTTHARTRAQQRPLHVGVDVNKDEWTVDEDRRPHTNDNATRKPYGDVDASCIVDHLLPARRVRPVFPWCCSSDDLIVTVTTTDDGVG